ncbi:hypothetical protein Tco_0112439, partial [Tanacetum coccineum]
MSTLVTSKKEGVERTQIFLKGNKVTVVHVQDPVLPPNDDVVHEEAPVLALLVDLAPHVETHAETVGREL